MTVPSVLMEEIVMLQLRITNCCRLSLHIAKYNTSHTILTSKQMQAGRYISGDAVDVSPRHYDAALYPGLLHTTQPNAGSSCHAEQMFRLMSTHVRYQENDRGITA